MNTKRGKLDRRLFPPLAVVLTALLLLSLALPSLGTVATDLTNEGQESQTVTARAQGTTGEDVPLAGAEGWAQASVDISSAPDEAVVSSVRVKYHVVNAEPSELEVQLLTSGAEVSHTLWDRESAEGTVLAQSTEEIAAFQGAPVNGTWSVAVQGGDAEGYIDDFSIVVYYEMEMPVLHMEGEGVPGTPGFLRLPEGAAPASPPPDEDEKPSGEGSSVVPQDVPPGAIIIETENFEGSFNPPGGTPPGWEVRDQSYDGYQRWWDDAHCDPCGGDWAAWPADGGANRVDPCAGTNYPNNMEALMIYGPFDLSNATDAGTEWVMWHDIEPGFDWVYFGYSRDGTDFYGWFFDGYNPCTLWNAYYPGLVGDPSVWVAWVFYSDASVRDRGPWVDDIVIWKDDGCATVRIDPPVKDALAGTLFTVDVVVENVSDLGAFQFDLAYDPTCVQATDVTLGPFLGSTGRSVAEVGPSFSSGMVTYGAYSWGASAGPNGDGVLATITFQAGMNECSGSALDLRNVSLTDRDGNPICVLPPIDGTVNVDNYPCFTPWDCPEDFNGNGVIDIQDIQWVASRWGQACPTR